jgi:hypothetical protein
MGEVTSNVEADDASLHCPSISDLQLGHAAGAGPPDRRTEEIR